MICYLGKTLLIEEKGKKIIVIGDLHLGMGEALRDSGVLIEIDMIGSMIKGLDEVFKKTGKVNEIVLLGDIKHYFGKIVKEEWNDVLKLFDYLKEKCGKIIVIRGNHDVLIKPIAKKAEIEVGEFYCIGKYCFVHGDKDCDEIWDKKIEYVVIGHGHPAVKLQEGVKIEKYKCFLEGKYRGKNWIIVPSFSEYSIGSDPRENEVITAWNLPFERFKVRIVGEKLEVFNFGRLSLLKK
ncbi:MAG: metallophosphoesterase [archaeon]|nr:metallophosphoesterase [archaeon]